MSRTPPHFEALEKMEQVDIPGLVEMMRQEGTVGRQDEPGRPRHLGRPYEQRRRKPPSGTKRKGVLGEAG